MAIIYQSNPAYATTTAKVVGPCWVEFPFHFRGDNQTRIYHHPMKQALADYAPLDYDVELTDADAKPDGSPFADDAAAYFVEDTNLQASDGGFVTFDRQFANIPKVHIEPGGFYGFEFPDVPGGIRLSKVPTSKTFSYDSITGIATATATLSASDAAEFDDGETLSIRNDLFFRFTFQGSSDYLEYGAISGAAVKSGNDITITQEKYYFSDGVKTYFQSASDNNTVASDYAVDRVISADRNSTAQLNSPGIFSYRYVKTNQIESLSLDQRFQLRFSGGTATNATTTATLPLTTQQYVDAALNGEYAINAEDEVLNRWKGNIYELETIKVQPR